MPSAPVPEPHFLLPEEQEPRTDWWRLTRERAVYFSVVLHLLLALLWISAPPSKPQPQQRLEDMPDPFGLIKLMKPPDPEPIIPIQFFPAPGPAAKAPGKKPLPSDLNRVAHGGDPKLPKAPSPKSVAKAGIQDLAEGPKGSEPGTKAAEAAKAANAMAGMPGDVGAKQPDSSPPRDLTQPQKPGPLRGIPQAVLAGLTAEQAAQALKGLDRNAGEGGGGWEHEGGFADSGPLSFDTANYEWGPYAAEMIRKIKRNWDIPALAQYGIKGRVTIRFFILKDGRVDGERILASSGIPPFDNASFQAILRASPFRPLPADLGHDREGVTVSFFYNVRPEEWETYMKQGKAR